LQFIIRYYKSTDEQLSMCWILWEFIRNLNV
jgi:hypothetical protein